MAISHWPMNERPREKLILRGASALSDAELLAIFLRTGLPGITAIDLARDLIKEFGGLGALISSDHTTFCKAKGVGGIDPPLLAGAARRSAGVYQSGKGWRLSVGADA